RKPSRPPYSNQLWFPIVGTTVPSPVTVATMPERVANDCTNPPLMLPSTLLPNRCVHCPPNLDQIGPIGAAGNRGVERIERDGRIRVAFHPLPKLPDLNRGGDLVARRK